MIAPMTYPRSLLVPPGSPGTFHCVSRCVRRAFLCGADSYTGRSFEHRRGWVEGRLHELADVFAVAIWGYAVMGSHLHVAVQTLPEAVQSWSDEEIAGRSAPESGESRDSPPRSSGLRGSGITPHQHPGAVLPPRGGARATTVRPDQNPLAMPGRRPR